MLLKLIDNEFVQGSKKYDRNFFPLSIFCPCIIVGRTESVMQNEVENSSACYINCLELGPHGCFVCAIAAACNCFLPCPLTPSLGLISLWQRMELMEQFNIDGGYCEALKACYCPCALFQHYRFMKDIYKRKLHGSSFSYRRSLLSARFIQRSSMNSTN